MNSILWRLVAGICLFAQPSRDAGGDDARDIADRFLAHLSANAPVAGDFRIESRPNLELQQEFRKKALENAKKDGVTVGFGPDKPALVCRWAWNGDHELVETLAGSNILRTFVRTPEAHLQQTEELNFNLDKPGPAPIWRPASFYYLWGGQRPWPETLKDCKYRLLPATAGAPSMCVVLEATNAVYKMHLFVEQSSGIYHGHRTWLADGKMLGEVVIKSIHKHSDGRVFPMSAEARLFRPLTGQLENTIILKSDSIRFPAHGAEFRRAMRLSIPKGAVINDHLLSQQIVLKAPTAVEELLEAKVTGKSVVFEHSPPATGRQTASEPGSTAWLITAIVLCIPLGCYLAYRGYSIWRNRQDR